MIRAFVFISAILFSICPAYEGLVCYECYMGYKATKYGGGDYKMIPCNEKNLTASQTLTCPEKSKCVYQVVDIEVLGTQIWRKCSDPRFEPCDPEALPAGTKMVKCSSCGTDRCNLQEPSPEEKTFTINITGNISLSIG